MSVNLSPVGGAGAQFCDNNGNPLNGGKLYTYSAGTTTPAATYTSAAGSVFHPNPIVLNAGGRVPDSGEIWLADNISYKFVLKTSADVLIATWDNINGINSNFVNYTIQEEVITATAGQTVFNLSTITYAPATNSLAVYIDGVNQIVTDSYIETDSNTVTFVSGLHDGALVKFTTAVPATGTATTADLVTYDPPFTGGQPTTVEAKLAQTVSVKDFGAVGDGVTDDTAAIQAAFSYCDPIGVMLYFPAGIYRITSSIAIPRGGAFGDSNYSSQILVDISTATSATNAITYGVSGNYTAARSGISNMWFKIADYSKETTMLYLDTPNHNSFMRDVKIDTGKGYCVKAAEFFTFYFDNVTFIGRFTSTPGPLDTLEGVGFSNVGATEINNVLFNKCTFTFLRKPLEATSGNFQGSNAVKFNQCLFESIGENIGNIEGYQANFDCCYFEALNRNQNAALTYSVMKGGANNIVFDQCLLNFTTVSTTLPLFDMQIGSVLFNDNTSLALPVGFTGSVIDKKTFGTRGQLIDNWSRYPVENAFLAVPSQWCGGYATNERPASPSFKAYSISRFEYEFNGLTTNGSFNISEFPEGFVQLKDGVAYYVNIEAEINYRNNTTGQVSYLKSNQSWYISGTETGASIAPNAVDNSQISDAGGFLTGAWLANNTLRYEATGTGYRRFALYRQTKTATAYPATVSTKYKVRISPTSTTLDNSVAGIVDRGNV